MHEQTTNTSLAFINNQIKSIPTYAEILKTQIKSKHSPSINGDDSVQNFETNTNKVVFQNFETGHADT